VQLGLEPRPAYAGIPSSLNGIVSITIKSRPSKFLAIFCSALQQLGKPSPELKALYDIKHAQKFHGEGVGG
jgi:hypothetical protein